VGPLWVGLAIDGAQTRRVLRRLDADLLRMPDVRLFLVARANLAGAADTLGRERVGPVTRLHFNGDLDSSLLVLPSLWQAVVRAVGGPIAVMAPARGALLYAPLAQAGALWQMARQVRRMDPWPLPPVLLVHRGEGWEAREGGAGD